MRYPFATAPIVLVAVIAMMTGCARTAESSPDDAQSAKELLNALKGISGGLNGTVTIHVSAKGGAQTSDGVISSDSSNELLDHTVTFDVKNGKAVATISYNHESVTTTFLDYSQHTVAGSRKETTIARATTTENVSVSLDLRNDGTYVVSAGTGGVDGTLATEDVSTLQCKGGAVSCNPGTTKNADSTPQKNVGALGGSGEGRVDPKGGNKYVGTAVTKVDFPRGGGTRTMRWELWR
jgi:hypothetical protein